MSYAFSNIISVVALVMASVLNELKLNIASLIDKQLSYKGYRTIVILQA